MLSLVTRARDWIAPRSAYDVRREAVAAVGLGLLIVPLYLFGISGFPLAEPDEGRYAEIPREMLVTGDWITPRLNYVKYFEKPPLVYWATAISLEVCGMTEGAARLPSLVGALGTVAVTGLLALRVYGPATAVLSAAVLATSPFFAFMGIILTLDMSLTFFLSLSYAAAWFAFDRRDRRFYVLLWVSAALAVLTKGPVSLVLVLGGIIPFLAWHGGLAEIRRALSLRGISIAVAIILPWYVVVSWRNPEFLRFFVVDQHIARYLWTREHRQPFWFFLPLLPAMMLPWSLAPLSAWRLWSARLKEGESLPATCFLLTWAVVVVGFFSLSTSKLATYVLPAFPPLAILLARGLVLTSNRGRAAFLTCTAWMFGLLGGGSALAGALLPHFNDHWRAEYLQPYLLVGGLGLAVSAVALGATSARSQVRQCVFFGTLILFLFLAMSARGVANDYQSLAVAAAKAMTPSDRIVMFRHYTQGVPFYSRTRATMVEDWGELEFGRRHADDQGEYFWPETDRLRKAWAGDQRLFLIINRKELAALDPPLPGKQYELASKDKKVLITNRSSTATAPPSAHRLQ